MDGLRVPEWTRRIGYAQRNNVFKKTAGFAVKRIAVFTLIAISNAFGAFEVETVNPNLVGRAGICSLHSASSNPAAFLESGGFTVRADYSNLFGIKELHCWDLISIWNRTERMCLSASVRSLGNALYQENNYALGYGRRLIPAISAGIMLRYYQVHISGYDGLGTYGISLGAKFYVNAGLRFSLLLQNLNGVWEERTADILPETMAVGCQWFPVKRLEVDAELFKDTLYPFSSRLALAVDLLRNLQALLGVQLRPDRFACGLRCSWKHLQFDAALLNHSALPATLYLGCCFQKP